MKQVKSAVLKNLIDLVAAIIVFSVGFFGLKDTTDSTVQFIIILLLIPFVILVMDISEFFKKKV